MRSSTVAFAVTLALANSASVLATDVSSSTSLDVLVPVTTALSTESSTYKPVYPTGSAYSSGFVSSASVSGKPPVYGNSTSLSTATASGAGTSTATATTEVSGSTTGATKTGPAASATASASSSAADALSLSGASWGVGSLMLGGMAVVFGFF
ncbi:hypothetical protein EYC80_000958 [Monilinia laxa]|uniref:Uncharacterized protein n=1 Tax=Monilinia laxa TaxID=61186 RepID=A0A5N6K7U4_MONLA|nr:hypothetical protein EYC80_000958 [Monilinia laxa]